MNKRRSTQKPLSIFDYKSLISVLDEAGIKRIHAYNIWHHLIQKNSTDISEVKNVPKLALNIIRNKFTVLNSYLVNSHTSKDGNTTKLIFRLQDFHEIETVIMRYGDDYLEGNSSDLNSENNNSKYKRVSLCVSSQIGCRMGCMFCATGSIGLRGSLLSGEIIQQLYYVRNILGEPVRNVVFMGMGEPLENYEEVIDAIRIMLDPRLFCLSANHILVSTVGIPSNIISIADDLPGIGLCLSLHAPNQALREKIIPIARLYRISDLIRSLDIFIFKTIINRYYNKLIDERNRHNIKNGIDFNKILISNKWLNGHNIVVIEYTLIKDVNDSVNEANELADLLINTPVSKNLLEDLIESRHNQFERYICNSKNEDLVNTKLKNNLVKIIYKELRKNYNRINFTLVNLIPYNKVSSNKDFETPSSDIIKKFALALNRHNVVVTVRKKMGDSIYGACGQLALKKIKDHNIEEINSCNTVDNVVNTDEDVSESDFEKVEKVFNVKNFSKNNSELIAQKGLFGNLSCVNIMDLFVSFFSKNYRLIANFLRKNKFSISILVGTTLIIRYLFSKSRKN